MIWFEFDEFFENTSPFKETHYGQDWEKVKVFCIQRPASLSTSDGDSTKSSIPEDQVKIGININYNFFLKFKIHENGKWPQKSTFSS